MKLYEVADYNHGWASTTWIDPGTICKVEKSGKIMIDHSLLEYGNKPEDLETVSEESVRVYLRGLTHHGAVRITWDTWVKLCAAAGIEVQVL